MTFVEIAKEKIALVRRILDSKDRLNVGAELRAIDERARGTSVQNARQTIDEAVAREAAARERPRAGAETADAPEPGSAG